MFSVVAFALWYRLTFFAGSYLFIHWLGIIASVFIVVSNPIHYALKSRRTRFKLILRIHIFGNLLAFLIVSVHFAQNVGRLAGVPQRLGEGLALYLVLFIVVTTGFVERFYSERFLRFTKTIHKYTVTVLLIVLLIHALDGFNIWRAVPSSSPIPSPFPSSAPTPSNSPSPSFSPSPSPTTSPSQTPTPPPSPSGPPPTLPPQEIREYQGEPLSSITSFRENSIQGPQYVNMGTYHLTITGLVNESKQYTYDEVLTGFQTYQKVVTLYCVEGWSVKLLWEGILLKDLFNQSGVNSQATVAIFKAYDGYTTALPLRYILDNNILIAYKMNNVTLPPERGFPFELVAESKYGYKWIKWITEIELSSNTDYLGYWEIRGWPNDASLPFVPK
jgi:hypothetical protein